MAEIRNDKNTHVVHNPRPSDETSRSDSIPADQKQLPLGQTARIEGVALPCIKPHGKKAG